MEQSRMSKTRYADMDELCKKQRKCTAMFTKQKQANALPFHPQ